MQNFIISIRYKILSIVVLGLIYPVCITIIAKIFFPFQAGGSLIEKKGQVIGSSLIAQSFSKPEYFWPRPSAVKFDPQASGGSNLGPASEDLKKAVQDRTTQWGLEKKEIPSELLFASGSGLDPHLSPEAAIFQARRVAQVRHLEEETVVRLIHNFTEEKQFGFIGERIVNVLKLNLALDQIQSKQ